MSDVEEELRIAQENLNRRYLNNNDLSAGRSARAITDALTALSSQRKRVGELEEALRSLTQWAEKNVEGFDKTEWADIYAALKEKTNG